MKAGIAGKLYTPELLGLAVGLSHFPLGSRDWQAVGESRSRTCGSTAQIGVNLDNGGRISGLGMKISACVMWQASAAVLGQDARGKSSSQIADTRDDLAAWLDGSGSLPDWPGFEIIIPAREFTGRHGAILLPWNAMLDALSKVDGSG